MKECTECFSGFVFAYKGAPAEKCPTCNGTGHIELTDEELKQERGLRGQVELHRRNVRLSNRI